MALTADIIKQNAALATLSDDQLNTLVQLSLNDENQVIARKTGEIHGAYERDLEEAGFKKPDGWKSPTGKTQVYAYMKEEVFPKLKSLKTINDELDSQKALVVELNKKITEGSKDEVLKQKLKDAETKITVLESTYQNDKQALTKKIEEKEAEMTNLAISNEFEKVVSGLKFKDESIIPASVRNAFVDSAKRSILTVNKPDFVQDDNGNRTLVFRNDKGEILHNPANNLKPFSAKDLLEREIKDIIDAPDPKGGAGGKGGQGGNGAKTILDLGTAKSQVQADEIIMSHLISQGMERGTVEFQKKHTEIRTENAEISKLPIQ